MTHTEPRTPNDMARSLLRALGNTGIIVYYQSLNSPVMWSQNVPATWAGGDVVGLLEPDFLPQEAAGRILELKRTVLASGTSGKIEFRNGHADGGRWYDMWLDADVDDAGDVVGVVTTVVDITDRKHREQTLRALLREVSHRSKNLLAIIQSVATQTGRYAPTIDAFLDRFRGRLQSLASSQDLVTSSNWRGATLRELIRGQVDRYLGEGARGVRFEGADVHLSPNAALHIGLALHELVVNSLSHGALSTQTGRVALRSVVRVAEDGGREMVLTWDEDTEPMDGNGERRFGSIALERVVPQSLDGVASLTVANGHVGYRLEVPAANFETD